MEELVDLVHRTGEPTGGPTAVLATRTAHDQSLIEANGIELQALQHKRRTGDGRGVQTCQREQVRERRPELPVRARSSVARGQAGQLPVGQRAPEQVQKIVGVGQSGGRVDRRPIVPEIAIRKLRIESARRRR